MLNRIDLGNEHHRGFASRACRGLIVLNPPGLASQLGAESEIVGVLKPDGTVARHYPFEFHAQL
jgi:hypothetical protein